MSCSFIRWINIGRIKKVINQNGGYIMLKIIFDQKNAIGRVLARIGCIIVGFSVLCSLICFFTAFSLMGDWGSLGVTFVPLSFTGAFAAFAGGFIFFGFSEVIRLLSRIALDESSKKGDWDIRDTVTYKMANGGK